MESESKENLITMVRHYAAVRVSVDRNVRRGRMRSNFCGGYGDRCAYGNSRVVGMLGAHVRVGDLDPRTHTPEHGHGVT